MTHLDHNPTSHSGSGVIEVMVPTLEETFGNQSSNHRSGIAAAGLTDNARRKVADAAGTDAADAAFTSSATEASNLDLAGLRASLGTHGKHIKFPYGCSGTHAVAPRPSSRPTPFIWSQGPSIPFRPIIISRLSMREILARESI